MLNMRHDNQVGTYDPNMLLDLKVYKVVIVIDNKYKP
jgi:hypothetical protein